MKAEQLYYENPELWKGDKFAGVQTERAKITKQWIPAAVTSVLDVGCGNGVVTNILDQFAVGVDRSWATLAHLQVPHCQTDAANLPFADQTFDAVISTEVIEHLPYNIYKQTLAEIVRVSRQYILISVPYQEDLLSNQIMCPVCSCRFHPSFHMRAFTLHTMRNLFSDFPQVQMTKAAGIMEISTYRFKNLGKRILNCIKSGSQLTGSFANRVCPMCGYFGGRVGNTTESSKIMAVKSILDPFWPRQHSYHWWLALYSKV